MPLPVKTSLWLQILSVVVVILGAAISSVLTQGGTDQVGPVWVVLAVILIAVVPVLALWVFILRRAYQGRNWARWLLTILCLVSLLVIPSSLSSVRATPTRALLDLSLTLTQLCAVALLWAPASSAWYREKTASAHAT